MKHAWFIVRSFGLAELLKRIVRKSRAAKPVKIAPFMPGPAPSRPAIVVIDEFVPFFDRSAGAKRIYALLSLMQELGWTTYFSPERGGAIEPYAGALRNLGVRLVSSRDLGALMPFLDAAWLSRPSICEKYRRQFQQCGTRVIFDTVDLHHRRMSLQAATLGRADDRALRMRETEFALAAACDAVVVTTPEERQYLQERRVAEPFVVPIVQAARATSVPGVSSRTGIVMLGNYTHEPNVDAAKWFCENVLPIVRKTLPKEPLTIAGADPTREIMALRGRDITVTGFLPDLEDLFDKHRVFVAPLRFGAGQKGKVLEALSAGIPVVTTPVGAEGIGLRDGVDSLIREGPAEFADAVITLSRDDALWKSLSRNGKIAGAAFAPPAVKRQLAAVLSQVAPAS